MVLQSHKPKWVLWAHLDNVGSVGRSIGCNQTNVNGKCGHFEHGWTSGAITSIQMKQMVKCGARHRPQENEHKPHWTLADECGKPSVES